MALMKLCRCGKRIEYHIKYCDSCTTKIENEKREKVKQYDREVRYSDSNKRYTDFYHSNDWITLSDIVKLQYNGLCAVCAIEQTDGVVESDTTHHIEELKQCWELRLVEGNLIPLCHSCHNKIHIDYSKEDKIYLKNIIKKFKNKYK